MHWHIIHTQLHIIQIWQQMSVFLTLLHFEKTWFHLLETLDTFQDLVDLQEQRFLLPLWTVRDIYTHIELWNHVCNGSGDNTNYIFSIPEDITVPVTNGVAQFKNIEIYEGNFVSQNFTVDTSLTNQRFILNNSFIDTSTISVKVKQSETATSSVTYKQIDNIIGITSTSSSYLLQEIEDERYELIFGDNVIGKKLSNDNYVTVSYITTDGKEGNGASEFSFVGNITNQDGAAINANLIGLVSTLKSQEMVMILNLYHQLSIMHLEFTLLSIVQSLHPIMNRF